jgi:hypothetical protein
MITNVTLRQLVDADCDWSEGDETINAAIRELALRELLTRTEAEYENEKHTTGIYVDLSKFWTDMAKKLGWTPEMGYEL